MEKIIYNGMESIRDCSMEVNFNCSKISAKYIKMLSKMDYLYPAKFTHYILDAVIIGIVNEMKDIDETVIIKSSGCKISSIENGIAININIGTNKLGDVYKHCKIEDFAEGIKEATKIHDFEFITNSKRESTLNVMCVSMLKCISKFIKKNQNEYSSNGNVPGIVIIRTDFVTGTFDFTKNEYKFTVNEKQD